MTKGTITHKLLSCQYNASDLHMLVPCHLPTDIDITSDPATKDMVTTNLDFIQLSIGHLKHD